MIVKTRFVCGCSSLTFLGQKYLSGRKVHQANTSPPMGVTSVKFYGPESILWPLGQECVCEALVKHWLQALYNNLEVPCHHITSKHPHWGAQKALCDVPVEITAL